MVAKSYKEKLLGEIPGAYEQALNFEQNMETEVESDDETSELSTSIAVVNLSSERKTKIRSQWINTLIVKVVGRVVGYHFLTSRLTSLWNLTSKMVCVGLGHDFFLVKLSSKEDYVRILSEGPWFVRGGGGGHYLSIWCWEPNFKPSTANVTFVAIRVHFLELPIKYYEPSVLKDIGSATKLVLQINKHTVAKDRGDSPECVSKSILINLLSNSLRLGDWNNLSSMRE